MKTIQSLDTLPFDVFYQIATSLDDRDFVNLSRTSRTLYSLSQSEQIARKTVENFLPHSKEGQAALVAQSGFRKAVGHRLAIHEAVAMADPYSVVCVGYGAEFLYNQGHLCYRSDHWIRLLYVHGPAFRERVMDLREAIPRLLETGPVEPGVEDRVTLLSYCDDILVFRVADINATEDALLAVNMAWRETHQDKRRFLLYEEIPASAPVFVRHCGSYIWYGTFTAADGSDGVWSITGMDLESGESIDFPLDRVVDGDLGQTLCFEIHNEHLYAVSTQVAADDDEVHSSFYHWFCHAPREDGRKWNGRLWRREHQEGPINEMWTDLSIRKDETTGRPVILECRREWRDGKSENHRTYYTQRLPTPEEALAPLSGGTFETPSWVSVDDDLENDHPYDERPAKRLRRHYHAEYESGSTMRQEFIAARTKHRSYHLGASTFVDIVNDPVGDNLRSRDRIRLRTVSRKRKCPIDEEGIEGPRNRLFQPTQMDQYGFPVEGSEERFECRGVRMWPPDDAPPALQSLLCPGPRTGSVKSIADERSIVYSIDAPGLPPNQQALIVISFDPHFRIPITGPLPTATCPPEYQTPGELFPPKLKPPPPLFPSNNLVQETLPFYLGVKRGYYMHEIRN
ncbi:Cyclin-like F-box [Penicillium camemberti]|uniref:Cyclin-like F-box n=1 Tax=Penicillium camemberti (strain FM 013) TaxID=1429867 RepID=A0A0G4P832_PENC3|nr:Cyclin-like F-box [Penicillium camemberti]